MSDYRIYIVEDDAAIAMEIGDRLADLHYEVCGTAERGETALVEIPRCRPDVVLMDIRLAGSLSGLETAHQLRGRVDVPVVFLAEASDATAIGNALPPGSYGYLVKPFEERELHATLQAALYRHRLEKLSRSEKERLEAAVADRTAELQRAKAALGENAQRLTRMFLAAPAATCLTDEQTGEFIDVNDRFVEVVGRPRESLIGRSCAEIGLWKDPTDRLRLEAIAARDGHVAHEDVALVMPDGTVRDFDASVNLVEVGGRRCALSCIADITARKQAERAWREREALLSSINANLSGTCVYRIVHGPGERVECIYVSPTFERLFGVSAAAVMADARAMFDRVLPDDLPILHRQVAEILRTGEPLDLCVRLRMPPGQQRWVHFRSRLVERRADGAHVRDGVAADITPVKVAEAELQIVHQRLQLALRASRTCTWENDLAADRVVLDPAWADMVGEPSRTMVTGTRALLMRVHPTDRRACLAQARRAILGATDDYQTEHRIATKQGGWIWIRSHGRVTRRDAQGRARFIVGTNTDITARKKAEDEVRQLNAHLENLVRERTAALAGSAAQLMKSEQLYRGLVESINQGYYVADRRSLLTYCNPAVIATLGIPEKELIGRSAYRLVVDEDRPRVMAACSRWITDGASDGTIEYRIRTKSGQTMWVEQSTTFVRDPGGRLLELRNVVRDVSERKAAEALLRRSEERFQLVNEATFDVIWDQDVATGVIWWNDQFLKIFGHTPEEAGVSDAYWRACLHPDDRARVIDHVKATLASRSETWSDSYRFRRKNGSYAHVEDRARIIRDAAGRPVRLIGAMQDVTRRKVAESLLRQSEERFRAVFDRSPIMIALLSFPDGRLVELNTAAMEAFGYGRGEALGRTSVELGLWVQPADRDRYLRALREGGQITNFETRLRRRNGEVFTALISASRIEIARNHYSLNSVLDITAQREVEERYRHVFENAPVGIYRTTPEGRVILANPALLGMVGCATLEELAARNLKAPQWFVAQPRAAFEEAMQKHGVVEGLESAWLRADGAVVHVRENARAIRDPAGQVLYYEGTAENITARRETEAALRESEARFRGVFDATPVPILLSTVPDGRILEANAASLAGFGYTREEVIGRNTLELAIWAKTDERTEFFRRIQTEGGARNFEAVMRSRSGAERIMLCNGTLLQLGGRSCLVASAIDITAQREAETERTRVRDQVFRAQKFEALGNLAGGIAHDFNNILTGVLNYTALAVEDCPPTHPQIRQFLCEVLHCGERARELVRQILLFSRAEDGKQEPVLLQNIVKEALGLLRATVPATAKIDTQIDPQIPVVCANPTQMHQIVMNLVINSAHALKDQPGRIEVRLDQRVLDDTAVRDHPELKPGPHVRLEVSDTGCGMDATVLARLFEPFFTTKPVGVGTGLGLAVVHSVVRSHRGAIAVRSQPGVGTTFEVFFPAETKPARTAAPAVASLSRGDGEHILLVDDEPVVLRSTELVLLRLGYRVTPCVRPADALTRFSAAPQQFAAVITDLQMPGMTGLSLAQKIRERNATVPVILASGFTGAQSQEALQAHGVTALLQKPVAYDQLAWMLARIFNGEVRNKLAAEPPGKR